MPGPTHDLLAELAEMLPPPTPLTERQFLAYVAELSGFPADVQRRAVQYVIRTSRFFPKVAELREAAAECLLALPTEAAALAQIDARIRWGRAPEDERPAQPPELHPLVREIADRVGGFPAFRGSGEPAVVRGQFGRLYREERSRAVRAVQADGETAAA